MISCYGLVFLELENVPDFFILNLMKSKPDDDQVIKFTGYI